MNEYSITFFSPAPGVFTVDIHRCDGASHPAVFQSVEGLEAFFASMQFQEEMLAQFKSIYESLEPGLADHSTMFLPDAAIERWRAGAAGHNLPALAVMAAETNPQQARSAAA